LDPTSLLVERGGPSELNEFDLYAVEESIRVAESGDAEVVVVTVGPPAAEESLRHALALGAHRAALVSDPAIAGSDLLGTARVLAAVLAREAPDLVLFGQQSKDGGGGAMCAAVAERLDQPFLTQAAQVTLAGRALTVRRETEYGTDVLEATLPALIAVSDAINEPRYTSLKGRMAAKKKPVEVLTIADLGLSPGVVGAEASRTEVLASARPPSRGDTITIDQDADPAATAETIVAFLAARELV
jgi:electron transfer flavoprotein beta subunit